MNGHPTIACQKSPGKHRPGRQRQERSASTYTVPPAEKQVESAAKKHQCKRSHRSEERDACAIRATATGGWPEVE